jgi:hypothetical protein
MHSLTINTRLSTMTRRHPTQQSLPPCLRCHYPSMLKITSSSNRNGNANRLYSTCTKATCKKFLGFRDDRGLDVNNPSCHCGVASRRQINGRDHKVPRAVHFVCVEGNCSFYNILVDEEDQQVVVEDGMVELLAKLKII